MVQTINVLLAVNAINKSNTLTNSNLINELKNQWTEMKVQLLVKKERLLIGPVCYVNFTHSEQTDWKSSNVPSPG